MEGVFSRDSSSLMTLICIKLTKMLNRLTKKVDKKAKQVGKNVDKKAKHPLASITRCFDLVLQIKIHGILNNMNICSYF